MLITADRMLVSFTRLWTTDMGTKPEVTKPKRSQSFDQIMKPKPKLRIHVWQIIVVYVRLENKLVTINSSAVHTKLLLLYRMKVDCI